jgi:patatin-related protein
MSAPGVGGEQIGPDPADGRGVDDSSELTTLVREIRLAVVMYGGVSLAVYINGVAQELLSLVRATAREKLDPLEQSPLLHPDSELAGAERVYREVARKLTGGGPVRVRFVADVLSGTSAGGLNAIFLAKALVHEGDLGALKSMWIDESDFAKLINDKASLSGLPPPPLTAIVSPRSLLNSERMERLLGDALGGFDAKPIHELGSRYVSELDLRVTATDLRGLRALLPFGGGAASAAQEKRHTKIFHFRHENGQTLANGFGPENSPFLAYVARSTSAFPFALEPMQLSRIADELGAWPPAFYPEYPADGTPGFPDRAFGDGGILDNKPFTSLTKDLRRRGAKVRVDRKLVYVEPSPEHFERELTAPPDAVGTAKAALLSIPRYETIRGDLEALYERNTLIDRTVEAINRADKAELSIPPASFDDPAWTGVAVETNINALGPGYPVYERLRVLTAVEELATLVAAARGSGERPEVVRDVGRRILAWVDASQRPRSFLWLFDLPYRSRRLEFLLNRIGQIERREPPVEGILAKAGVDPIDWIELAEAVAPLRRSLTESLRLLTDLRRSIVADKAFRAVIYRRLPADEQLLTERINEAASIVADKIGEITLRPNSNDFSADVDTALSDAADAAVSPNQKAVIALCAWTYQSYEAYDSIVLPLIFGSPVGEAGAVDVIRISPDDALTLRRKLVQKTPFGALAGDTLNHFGAFLDENWRKHDLLWGRLDGAERLIGLLVRGTFVEAELDTLVAAAHDAILEEEEKGSSAEFIETYGIDAADSERASHTLERSSTTTAGILRPIATGGEKAGFLKKAAAMVGLALWRLIFWRFAFALVLVIGIALGVNLVLVGWLNDASWLILLGTEVLLAGALFAIALRLLRKSVVASLGKKIQLPTKSPWRAD